MCQQVETLSEQLQRAGRQLEAAQAEVYIYIHILILFRLCLLYAVRTPRHATKRTVRRMLHLHCASVLRDTMKGQALAIALNAQA